MSLAAVMEMGLPENLRVLPLPDLPPDTLFTTIGTDGTGKADINGDAAALFFFQAVRVRAG